MLKEWKDRFEPFVWFIASVIVPIIGAFYLLWQVIVSPAIERHEKELMDTLRSGLEEQIKQLKKLTDSATASYDEALKTIKKRIADEFDSTYYVTKTFHLNISANNEDVLPASLFFYAAKTDIVILYIWSSGAPTDAEITINDRVRKLVSDYDKPSWTNVDITADVRKSGQLTIFQYPGIGENVYNIKITPIPRELHEPRKRGIGRNFDVGKNKTSKNTTGPSEVDIHALVIVKRSPF